MKLIKIKMMIDQIERERDRERDKKIHQSISGKAKKKKMGGQGYQRYERYEFAVLYLTQYSHLYYQNWKQQDTFISLAFCCFSNELELFIGNLPLRTPTDLLSNNVILLLRSHLLPLNLYTGLHFSFFFFLYIWLSMCL